MLYILAVLMIIGHSFQAFGCTCSCSDYDYSGPSLLEPSLPEDDEVDPEPSIIYIPDGTVDYDDDVISVPAQGFEIEPPDNK